MKDFEALLAESVTVHGHICAGQVIGVRMSMLALQRIGIDDPRGADRKKLYVLVEIDRCATDAIQSVTGCSLGKRSMYFHDLGVMAATFVNLETGRAVRVTAREEARDLADRYCRQGGDKYSRQLEAYKVMAEDELFLVQDVAVDIPAVNLPGRPLKRVQCSNCHDWVQDGREVDRDGELLCRSCAFGRYYRMVETAE
ncbi:MAG: FmdE family protein [Desulfoprunum sp.]|jgi:formylmethanofuran dehydrogenase subunit E|uniref:FmdE family protein n=1 Tax=Desulfoprunum sp. TaxID=2020866 RepID=UPI00052C18D7|nr:formylmethanofuran dehydrogenase [Desulfobulbus sp. Tol-SR]